MKTRKSIARTRTALAVLGLALGSVPSLGQVPVDDAGNVIGDGSSQLGDDGVPLKSASELEELVGPVALYPDDLLAIVLPAATYPLQIVEAARFLADLEANPELEPGEDWDDSIVALVNYPEVVDMLNDDLDWTWQLGEAVVAQQGDVIRAIASFRDRAHAAGNLKSDENQTVVRNEEVIEISPVNEEVIYVPYYEPERVVVYQSRPVYHYYPRAYPVYYYPYPSYHSYGWGSFWGVTTAFTIGWNAHCLNVFHPTYYGHPYYGYSYWNNWWYRNPSVTVYNNHYYDQRQVHNRYSQGDRWRSQGYTRLHYGDQRITRNRYYPNPATADGRQASVQARSVSSGERAARVNQVQQSGSASRQHDGVQEIRQALIDSRAAPNAAVRVPQTQGSSRSQPSRETGVRVREVRDALTASRETLPAERGAATAARPDSTTARPTVPTARDAVPAPRPTIRTWNGNNARQTTQVAPARPAPARASAPSHRSPPSDSRAAPSRPAQSASTPSRNSSSAAPARARTSHTR